MLPPYILFTALTAQLIYILVNWYFFKRKEYYLYAFYILIIAAYYLNKYVSDDNGIAHIGQFEYGEVYIDKILALLSYAFYFEFARYFVEAPTRYPSINKLMRYAEIFVFCFIVFDSIMLYTSHNIALENILFLPVNILLFLVMGYVFVIMLRRNEVLDRFIIAGSMLYGICACITMILGQGEEPTADWHIIYLQIGTVIEMICLNAGLVYKSKMLQRQTTNSQQELIKKYKENQELFLRLGGIREKISRDLHDDVGATLSSIKAYSEILKSNPGNLSIAELIKESSAEMIDRLEVIAWATNPAYDNFKSLKNMMLRFASAICHLKNIEFNIQSDGINDNLQIPGETRQHIFVIFKEMINNMLKYADANICTAKITTGNNLFLLQFTDNGKGFDGKTRGTGNGLLNMQKRAEELGGNLKIVSSPGKGSAMILDVPYPFKIPVSLNPEH